MGITKWSDLSLAFTSAATITREAVQLGSVNYMSPEQRDDPHFVTPATDVYSLGVSWYEMLLGRVASPQAFAARRAPAAHDNTTVSALIVQMTSYDPSDRPPLDEVIDHASRLVCDANME